ncbi:MAG: hypothetical protein P0S94_05420 [Simkaniaceae bacterium]|nr:hypothetical protein [Simkaniaceae bacterium]
MSTNFVSARYNITVAPPTNLNPILAKVDLLPLIGTATIIARLAFGQIKATYASWDIKPKQAISMSPEHQFEFPDDCESETTDQKDFIDGCNMRDKAIYSSKSALLITAVVTAALYLVGAYFLPAALVATALPLMYTNFAILTAINIASQEIDTFHALDNYDNDEIQPTLAGPESYLPTFVKGTLTFKTVKDTSEDSTDTRPTYVKPDSRRDTFTTNDTPRGRTGWGIEDGSNTFALFERGVMEDGSYTERQEGDPDMLEQLVNNLEVREQ